MAGAGPGETGPGPGGRPAAGDHPGLTRSAPQRPGTGPRRSRPVSSITWRSTWPGGSPWTISAPSSCILDRWFPYYYPAGFPGPGAGASPGGQRPGPLPARLRPLRRLLKRPAGRGTGKTGCPARSGKSCPSGPTASCTLPCCRTFCAAPGAGGSASRTSRPTSASTAKPPGSICKNCGPRGCWSHNGQRSAAVRYCLADRFLKVRAEALRREIAEALGTCPGPWP